MFVDRPVDVVGARWRRILLRGTVVTGLAAGAWLLGSAAWAGEAEPPAVVGQNGSATSALTDPVGDALAPVGDDLSPVTTVAEPVTVSVVEPVTVPVQELVTAPVEEVAATLEPVAEAAHPMAEAVQPVVESVTEPVISAVEPVLDPVTDAVQPAVEPVTDLVQPVIEPVTDAVRPVVDVAEPVIEPVRDATGGLPDTGVDSRPRVTTVIAAEPADLTFTTGAAVPAELTSATVSGVPPTAGVLAAADTPFPTLRIDLTTPRWLTGSRPPWEPDAAPAPSVVTTSAAHPAFDPPGWRSPQPAVPAVPALGAPGCGATVAGGAGGGPGGGAPAAVDSWPHVAARTADPAAGTPVVGPRQRPHRTTISPD